MVRQACKRNEVMCWLKLKQFQDAIDLCTAAWLAAASELRPESLCTKEILEGGALRSS